MPMDFEATFFDSIVRRTLFYEPKIEIKPVHLANGLFRAVCGYNLIAKINMISTLLGADGTLYGTPNFSSYTLSHVTHITSDNYDHKAGEWPRAILEHG